MKSIENEDTTFCSNVDDATQIVNPNPSISQEEEKNDSSRPQPTSEEDNSKYKTAKKIGGMAVGGVFLGTTASMIMDMKGAQTAELSEIGEEQAEADLSEEGILLPELTVEVIGLPKESPVNDEMTFEEAFSAAREALGAGSAFEWHGNIYATYTQEEWTLMTDDQKSDFYSALHMPNPYSTGANAESNVEDAPLNSNTLFAEVADSKPEETITAQTVVETEEDPYGEDIPVVSVGNPEVNDNDIQILGVTQDISTGYNVGHLSVNGEEVVVIDVDGDMVFDSMVGDFNHDGEITSEDIIDIREHALSLNDIQGHPDVFVDPMTSPGETPDYLSELVE